jgi:acyl-CoA thioesterase FadM
MSDGTLAAEAEAVVVPRDPKADRSRPLSEAERELLAAELEGETQAEG